MMSMRRRICGKSPAEIKLLRREEIDLPVTFQDFQVNLKINLFICVKLIVYFFPTGCNVKNSKISFCNGRGTFRKMDE